MFDPHTLLSLTLSSLALLSPQEAGNDLDVGDASALVEDGGRVARVGVADVEFQRFWTVVPLAAAADGLREQPARVIAPAWHFVPAPSRVDVLRRGDATWALSQDAHQGATRMLELLEFRGALFDGDVPDAP